ncbi:Low-density lipoprotein receptor-related protein 11, partial [Ophiophagus hannah]
LETDEPPLSKAGEDIILQLPVDWVILDGRESVDDHGITRYEWTLLQGASSVDMQVPQPGTLKLSHMQEGKYTLQLTVTDTAGQRSSDNISVTVLPMIHSELGEKTAEITVFLFYGKVALENVPDTSSSVMTAAALTSLMLVMERTTALMGQMKLFAINVSEPWYLVDEKLNNELKQCLLPLATGSCNRHLSRWHFDAFSGTCMHFIYGGCKGNENNFLQESDCLAECVKVHGKDTDKNDNDIVSLKSTQIEKSLPVPETGAVLPLALGLAITALLLLMVACRLRLVRQKLKKARPTTSEESDYLINGMYL